MGQAVVGGSVLAAHRAGALRVCLPRTELRPHERGEGRADPGARSGRSTRARNSRSRTLIGESRIDHDRGRARSADRLVKRKGSGMMKTRWIPFLVVASSFLLLSASAWAQSSITGVVRDTSGA